MVRNKYKDIRIAMSSAISIEYVDIIPTFF